MLFPQQESYISQSKLEYFFYISNISLLKKKLRDVSTRKKLNWPLAASTACTVVFEI